MATVYLMCEGKTSPFMTKMDLQPVSVWSPTVHREISMAEDAGTACSMEISFGTLIIFRRPSKLTLPCYYNRQRAR